jgi:hypothetical protein
MARRRTRVAPRPNRKKARNSATTWSRSVRETPPAFSHDQDPKRTLGEHRTHEVLAPGNGSVFTLRLPVGVVRWPILAHIRGFARVQGS